MTQVARERLLAAVEKSTLDFCSLLEQHNLGARIASCPDFDLAGLASHLGGIHLWAAAALRSTDAPPRPDGAPQQRAALVDWYAGAARGLLDALRSTDPSTPCFTFGPPQTAAFWVRRQAHETTIHLWDAQSPFGEPAPLDPDLSADGISEALSVFLPRQVALGRVAAVEQAVALEATDTDGRWLVGRGNGAVATVRGPAATLLLLLWKRASLDDPALQHDGDPRPTLSLALTP